MTVPGAQFAISMASKVILLGNEGVGKTCLLTRWLTGQFEKRPKPTISVEHRRKQVKLDDIVVDLFVWDTAGTERYQALTPLYCHSATAAIIVTAIDEKRSFDAIPSWINIIKQSCECMPPLLLAVNKFDITKDRVYTEDEIESRFSEDFVSTMFVSAASGEGVDGLFTDSARHSFQYLSVRGEITKLVEQPKRACC
jgi:small GTP-binding protein